MNVLRRSVESAAQSGLFRTLTEMIMRVISSILFYEPHSSRSQSPKRGLLMVIAAV